MNSMTIERMQQIHDFAEGSNPSEVMNLSAGEIALLARIALAARKAEPVAWTDEQELRSVQKDGCGYLFKANPVSPHADPRRVILIYTTPPAQGVTELAGDVKEHFLAGYDAGHSRGFTCGRLYGSDGQVNAHRVAAAETYLTEIALSE